MMMKMMSFVLFMFGIKLFLMVLLLKLEIIFFISLLYFFENDRKFVFFNIWILGYVEDK